MEACLAERPKRHLHGSEELWGRTAVAAFEQWREVA